MAYGLDRFHYPIVIASDTTFVVTEDPAGVPSAVTATLPAGTYYTLPANTTIGSTTYNSIYAAIEAALVTAGAANTYAFDNGVAAGVTPSLSTGLPLGGVAMTRATGTDEFELTFSSGSFDLDPGYFGFDGTSDPTSASGVINCEISTLGDWTCYTLSGSTASDKRSFQRRELYESSTRPSDLYQVEWNTDTYRRFVYEYVPAQHVHEGRTGDAGYAATAQLDDGDGNNAFETLWLQASRLANIVVQHNIAGLTRSVLTTTSREVIRFANIDQRRDFANCVNMSRSNGELYTIDFDAYVVSGGYEH